MRQFKPKEFIRIVVANRFYYNRSHGDHAIYINKEGLHISIPTGKLECVIARRLIKENNLEVDIKKAKRNGQLSTRSSK